ncbi:hypothetical protein [Gracilibacillus saliphilus]|uniref:hypothetical protein n=1 Tax=Gracilibacillus saliphilus TaxID=543890 RepID=UPI0013D40BF3|nr:hypothetical protein [Gracilibacillus saliphilus]
MKIEGGNNIAIKIPKYKFEETVAFYKDVLGLPHKGTEANSVAFEFGSSTLWLDCMENYAQQDVWLELKSSRLEETSQLFNKVKIPRRDEVEIHEHSAGFWISDPAGTILRINPK